MSGRQSTDCQWCSRPLRQIVSMNLRKNRRAAYTLCDLCDSGQSWTPTERVDYEKHIPRRD